MHAKSAKKICCKKIFVLTTEEMLELIKKIKIEIAIKKACKQPQKHPIQGILENEENEVLENENNNSDFDCIVFRFCK